MAAAADSGPRRATKRVLVWGATGWIGAKVVAAWPDAGDGWEPVVRATSRLEEVDFAMAELDRVKPTHVLIAAGLTGRPTVDWCEDHKAEVLAVNYAGPLLLSQECVRRGIKCCILGSGCVFEHDEDHPNVSDDRRGWTEDDAPNFVGSFYSRTKAHLEQSLPKSVLYLRIRMPISGDGNPRCLLTKLQSYKDHVVDGLHNSITFLPDLARLVPSLMDSTCGILNFVQPAGLTHRQILGLVLGDEALEEFTFVDASKAQDLTKAPRSNCVLSTERLERELASKLHLKLRSSTDCLRDVCKPTK